MSLARNHEVQVADSVAWSLAFVGQRGFDSDDRSGLRHLPANRG